MTLQAESCEWKNKNNRLKDRDGYCGEILAS